MHGVRIQLLVFALASLGCGGDDTQSASQARTLGLEVMSELDHAAMRQCSCLVEQDILYASVDACLMVLGQEPENAECVGMALEAHGTPEHLDAARCFLDHLRSASACSESTSCEDIVNGTCGVAAADLPCNDAALALLAFLLEHCPDVNMFM